MVRPAGNIDDIIRRFLSSGKTGGVEAKVLAHEIDQRIRLLAQKSLKAAGQMAKNFVARSQDKERILYTTALRSFGRVSLMASDYPDALKAYREARKMLRRDWLVRGQIDRTLIDIYMYLEDYDEARRHARMAMATFRRHDSLQELAKTRVNYGNLFHRQDRHREAIRLYEEAYRILSRGKDRLSTALCCYNLANSLVQLFSFEKAREFYQKADKGFSEVGYDLYANEAKYGLAWLAMLEGDYHLALQALAECEENYIRMGRKKGEVLCQLDRAEAYLGLNLFYDARDAAQSAEKNARKLGIEYEAAKAAFFYAKALLGLGKTGVANKAVARAERGFKKAGNAGFIAAVSFLKAQMEAADEKAIARLRAARKTITKSQLPLWEAICDLQLMSRCPDDSNVVRRISRNRAVKTVPHLMAHWQTLLGDREANRGQENKARRHWSTAADILDAVRVKLPPLEMRSGFKRHREDPYLRMIGSELKAQPARAAAWSERYKTAGLWAVPTKTFEAEPLRKKAEQSLVELAARVTAVAHHHGNEQERNIAASVQSNRALRQLQERVRNDLSAIERHSTTNPVALESLIRQIDAISKKRTLIQFHFQEEELIAFVHQQGQTKVRRFPQGKRLIDELVTCWNFMMAREQYGSKAGAQSALTEEKRFLDLLGQKLWAPLEIDKQQRDVLIISDGRLGNLPWHAFRVDGEYLADQHEVIFSPSLQHYIKAAKARIHSNSFEIFVGQADDLKNARSEIAVLKQLGNGSVIVRDPCRRSDWPDRSEAQVWHYTGHAEWRPDNPFYSSLLLSDGPLFAADFRLKSNKVGLIVLAACRSGRASVLPGDEADGLVRSLLEMGAKNVLASHWAVSDRSTAYWMKCFYNRLGAGANVASAAAAAVLDVREKFPSAYDWSAFSIFGAGQGGIGYV